MKHAIYTWFTRAWFRIITSKKNHVSKKWCYMKTQEDTVEVYNPVSAYILVRELVFLKFEWNEAYFIISFRKGPLNLYY